jgi:hypothetical protein
MLRSRGAPLSRRYALTAVILLTFARSALGCSCVTKSVREERKDAALVFVGQVTAVTDRQPSHWTATVAFEVLQAWNRGIAKTLNVVTSRGGGSCGYLPEVGGVYLIFAHRDPTNPHLQMTLCSNNAPLLCAGTALRELGRPARRDRPLPRLDDAGSDDAPISQSISCARDPRPARESRLHLPRWVEIRNFSATILRDGAVRDLEFDLECADLVEYECTSELERRVRASIESWIYEPATLNGRPVAMRVRYP